MAFKKIEEHHLPDIQSEGVLYEHEETGAQVLHLENDDSNKAFTIGFKTPPYNDNGIAHILEHSVLNGSKKYPSKEPFVELIKGSLNTFVNAMTFSDKTIYPVASTNQKDFMNLMGVYLDAVFQPKLYTDQKILEQEGWHYHMEDVNDDLIYKGVVYNEMKGATASPERQLHKQLMRQLYPNSIYRHESGGDPTAIPGLTQEEFIEFHKNYYHPSNSFTVLYGNMDKESAFEALEEYFDGKGRLSELPDVSFTPEISSDSSYRGTYSVTAGDDPAKKTYLSLGWHVAEPGNTLDSYGLTVLQEILFGNNQSPLKKALLDAEIGGDISGGVSEIGYPSAFVMTAKYSEENKMEEFKQVVSETLEKLATNGIDQELIDAALNKITFQTKEAAISEDHPRGVLYAIRSLKTWLYGHTPFENLHFSKYLDQLEQLSQERYFENLIKEKLLNNSLRGEVILAAEPGKNDKIEEETLKKLQEYKASLSKEEVEAIVANTKSLVKRQETPDSPEDLAKIPMLTKNDLTTEVEEYPIHESSLEEESIFYHAEQFTSGIDYVSLYFDLKDLESEEYSLLSYLSDVLGSLATTNFDVASLQTQIDKHTGGIYGDVSIYEDKEGHIKPYFVLHGKSLEKSFSELMHLMKEIIIETKFDDTKELLTLTRRFISNFENSINFRSHVLAANRALSQVKPASKLNERTSGIDYFNFLKETRNNLESNQSPLVSTQLANLLKKLLNKKRLNVLYVGEKERVSTVIEEIQNVLKDLPSEALGQEIDYTPGIKQHEAFVTAQDVNYVGVAADARESLEYNGSSKVLGTVFRYNYLWNEIRVKGGAYGALYNHQRTGSFALSSYRDPNINKTIAVYENLPHYVEKLEISESELLKYIIGSISPMEQPKSAFSKGLTAFQRLTTGVGASELSQLKEEILKVDEEKLQQLHEDFAKVLADKTIVVIGNKAQIEKEKDQFNQVYDLF